MLDLIATVFVGAYCVALVWVLVWVPARTLRVRIALTGAFGIWLVAVTALADTGMLEPASLGPVPPGLLLFIVALVPLLAVWRSQRAIREPLLAVRPVVLMALHSFRLGGVFFVLLGISGRLAPSFAFIAGLGDIVTGGVALWLTTRRALGHRVSIRAIRAWNAFGLLDLVVALVTATLANPASPIGFLGSEPGMRTMMTVPWILVPAVIVPMLVLTHMVIGARLRSLATDDTLRALANA
jgi:hypothetical protein